MGHRRAQTGSELPSRAFNGVFPDDATKMSPIARAASPRSHQRKLTQGEIAATAAQQDQILRRGEKLTGKKATDLISSDPHEIISALRHTAKVDALKEMSIDEELKHFNKRPFMQKWYYRVSHNFRYNHIYVSILYRKKNDTLTGVEKLTVVLCYLLGAMVVNAAFYQNQQSNVFSYIGVAIISSAVVIPAKIILREMFSISGPIFAEKRNRFRKQYRKIIAQRIALDLASTSMSVEEMDRKLGLHHHPTEDEREARLERQEEYCELLCNDAHVLWQQAVYDEQEAFDELSDAQIILMNQEMRERTAQRLNGIARAKTAGGGSSSEKSDKGRGQSGSTPSSKSRTFSPTNKVSSLEHLHSTNKAAFSPTNKVSALEHVIPEGDEDAQAVEPVLVEAHTLAEADALSELEERVAKDLREQEAHVKDRRERALHEHPFRSAAEQKQQDEIERIFAQRDTAAKRKAAAKAQKKKKFRCPLVCKSIFMVVAMCWCIAASIVMLTYGIKFDLRAEQGGVAQDDDPGARSTIWLVSCLGSMATDIAVNEPVILCVKAAATILLGHAFSALVRWFLNVTGNNQ